MLTYFGKEAEYMAVKKIVDKGVKIKTFSCKATSIVPKYVLNHPNIEVLGYVTDSELVELYRMHCLLSSHLPRSPSVMYLLSL